MTIDDAVDRACYLWGHGRIVRVQLRTDGGADVGLATPSDPSDTIEHHQLDSHGRPTCHRDCRLVDDGRRFA